MLNTTNSYNPRPAAFSAQAGNSSGWGPGAGAGFASSSTSNSNSHSHPGSGFSSDRHLQDAYLHATIQQIDQLANEDVEMQAPISEYASFVVVDTNIILHHLEVLKRFVGDVERMNLPVVVVVPGAVTLELDSQKKRADLGFAARAGSTWLLEKVSQRRVVKAQANTETCKATGNWKIRERNREVENMGMYNDNLILDCCMYFSRQRAAYLCSADNNLLIEAVAQGLGTIMPCYHWSSRDIARGVWGGRVDETELERFEGYKESFRYASDAEGAMEDEDIMMSVDTEDDSTWTPEHPLSKLHEQIIDHFALLLPQIVGRVGGPEVRQRTTAEEAANQSRHAPRRRHYTEWSIADCLDYLNERKGVRPREPAAQKFLLKLDPKVATPYARRGWDWSRRQWEIAMENLVETGTAWGDVSISESVYHLQPHITAAFSL